MQAEQDAEAEKRSEIHAVANITGKFWQTGCDSGPQALGVSVLALHCNPIFQCTVVASEIRHLA